MRLSVVAVGVRPAQWVRDAVDDYDARLPADWRIQWKEVRPEQRTANGNVDRWRALEAQRIRAALPQPAYLIALDERGDDLTSDALARRTVRWRESGRSPVLVIGGPDGLDRTLMADADERIRLSSLTLPHALVRVLVAEQIFRAWSILSNHPYHRA